MENIHTQMDLYWKVFIINLGLGLNTVNSEIYE